MGNCIYCGKAAGFFRRAHPECKQKFKLKDDEIAFYIDSMSVDSYDFDKIVQMLKDAGNACFISNESRKEFYAKWWTSMVDVAFEDDLLSEEEEELLTRIFHELELDRNQLDKKGVYTKVVKGSVLREICNGNLPVRLEYDCNMTFNLQKSEKIIWMFKNVKYLEEKTRTQYVGGSSGFSIRIAKGLYYRIGAFKGERVKSSETVHADTGLLGITNKHIYFAGNHKRFRIAYKKIVCFEPFSDGIGVQRDAQTAKPQVFITGDGWFTYNLVTNLARM